MEQNGIQKEKIYRCKSCHYPICTYSLLQEVSSAYNQILLDKNFVKEEINLDIYKCLFAYGPEDLLKAKSFCYEVDSKMKKIYCGNDKHIIGYTIHFDESVLGQPLIIGLINLNELDVEENEKEFHIKKEIPIISQYHYTVLAKLKQLRYYTKQLVPTLQESMNTIKKEKEIIYEIDRKFDDYKLTEVLKKYNEIQSENKK